MGKILAITRTATAYAAEALLLMVLIISWAITPTPQALLHLVGDVLLADAWLCMGIDLILRGRMGGRSDAQ